MTQDPAEPLVGHAPAAGTPPSGPRALARARWAVWRSRGAVTAARGAALGPGVRFDLRPGARVSLGGGCAVGGGTRLHVTAGTVRIGAGAQLGDRCVLQSRTAVTIGAGARLADEVVLLDHRPRTADVELPVRVQGVDAAPIEIGARASVGARTVLSGGATVGQGAQLAAHLLIDGTVPDGARITGDVPPGPL
ncbi:hypothetical protein [Paraconexibacter sp. AEG42_29]|uniref:acyltransferase n=1 Tax=Paraconexibacter sp. AEG42_29 TaxID=2997339 RepID=UPI00339D5F55